MAPHDQAAIDGAECMLSVEAQNTSQQPILSGGILIQGDRSGGTLAPGGEGVRLTKEEKIRLLRLCILHQGDYRHGNKVFWVQIQDLLKEEISIVWLN